MPDMKKKTTALLEYLHGFNPLCVAIALSLLMLAVIIYVRGTTNCNSDTPSYISAWNDCYRYGEIDIFRTPVYPILIGTGRMLFGADHWGLLPTIVQIIVFYACGIAFSRMALGIISDRRVAWLTVFLYFLFYPIINTLSLMGTEALAFSLTALWMFCVWRFMQRARLSYGIAISLLTVAEIMLRPSLLILALAIAGMALAGVFVKQYRRQGLLLLLTLIPVGTVYKIYVDEMERLTGFNTISVVSVYNNYYMARQYNDIFPELLPGKPEAVELMRRYHKEGDCLSREYLLKLWSEITELEKTGILTYREMNDYAMAMKKNYPEIWYKYIFRRIGDSLVSMGPLKNACNYLVVLCYSILFVTAWIKCRKFSIINFLTLMIGGGSLLSLFLYAQNDFGRLMLPTSAVLILMGGQLLNCLRFRPFGFRLVNFYEKR